MLNLFSPWQLRRRSPSKKWSWDTYDWKPQAGLLSQHNMELGFNLNLFFQPNDTYDSSRLYCMHGGSIFFIQAINLETEEALVYSPHLQDTPWVKDTWYLTDLYDLAPVTRFGFDEAAFRKNHPDKSCPHPILWGSYVTAYNRR